MLTIDDVIITSLATSSVNGLRARELCAEAARRLADESAAADERAPLSIDAGSTHTLGGRYLLCHPYSLCYISGCVQKVV